MEIKYLTILRDNPSQYPDGRMVNNPLSYHSINNPAPTENQILEAIQLLEDRFNGGNSFPVVLRELLFIGGEYNWVLGAEFEWQQDYINKKLLEYEWVIERPYFVLEFWDSYFHFIYLDEGVEDPMIHLADYAGRGYAAAHLGVEEHGSTVSELVNHRAALKLEL